MNQDPEAVMDHLGAFVPLSIAAMFATIAFVRMKRPTANAKCFLSVLFSLTPWLAMTAWMTVVGMHASMKEKGGAQNWILLPPFLLWLASPVMAILGLLEFRRNPGKYIEGKGAAIATLVQVGFLAFVFGFGLYLERADLDENSLTWVLLSFQWGTFLLLSAILLYFFFKWGLPAYRRRLGQSRRD